MWHKKLHSVWHQTTSDSFFFSHRGKKSKVFDSDRNLCREFNFDLKIIYPCSQQHGALRLEVATGSSKQETLIKKHLCVFSPTDDYIQWQLKELSCFCNRTRPHSKCSLMNTAHVQIPLVYSQHRRAKMKHFQMKTVRKLNYSILEGLT